MSGDVHDGEPSDLEPWPGPAAPLHQGYPVRLELPAEPEELRTLRLIVAGLGNLARFNLEEIEDLKQAVGDAFVNYLGPGQPLEGRLRVEGALGEDRVDLLMSRALSPSAAGLSGAAPPSVFQQLGEVMLGHLTDGFQLREEGGRRWLSLCKRRPPGSLSPRRSA